jgi:glycosyltransferase involved in cell wall biosynthesis
MIVLVHGGRRREEWVEACAGRDQRPRLPLPFVHGAAFIRRGHQVNAIANGPDTSDSPEPFARVFGERDLAQALRASDIALIWGFRGVKTVLLSRTTRRSRCKAIVESFVWSPRYMPSLKTKLGALMTRLGTRLSSGLVVMTRAQQSLARRHLPEGIPVIHLTVGIDTQFYRRNDGPELSPNVGRLFEQLQGAPYVILSGDELRLETDAMRLVAKRPALHLVRIWQCSQHKREGFMTAARALNISDRCHLLEQVPYCDLRTLLQNAVCYAGFVDARWQPAGWTVSCESLAAGTPVVAYDGLATDELHALGAQNVVKTVPYGDIDRFAQEVDSIVRQPAGLREAARQFARERLDCETTADAFVRQVEDLYGCNSAKN